MKKTQLIELLALIRHTIVPFFSIVLLVGMSITLYAGLTWTGRALEGSIDEALEQDNASNFMVTSELGITDDNLAEIGQLDGVSTVEPAYMSYQTVQNAGTLDTDSDKLYCCVQSVTDQLNTVEVVEGALPSASNEVAILRICAQFYGYKVGDTITFNADGDDASVNQGMKYLKNKTVTITGIVSSPNYMCNTLASLGINTEGKQITCVLFAAKGAFDASAYGSSYPVAYVAANSLRGLRSFGNEYESVSRGIFNALEQTGMVLSQNRYNDIKDQAATKINDAQSQLDEAQAKIADAEAQITSGEAQLAEKKSDLASAQAELDTKVSELAVKEQESTAQLEQAQDEIDTGKEQLALMQQQYSEGQSEITYYTNMSASLKTLSTSILARFNAFKDELPAHASDMAWITARCAEVNAATAQDVAAFKQDYPTRPTELETVLDGLSIESVSIDAATKAYENATALGIGADKITTEIVQPGQEKLDEVKSAIDQFSVGIKDAEEQLASKKTEYNNKVALAESKIAEGRTQIADGAAQLADAESQLNDGKAQLQEKKAQYAEGEQKLSSLKTKVEQLKYARWFVSDRDDTYVYQLADTTAQTLRGLRFTMALLFVIVGLLVCYSVIARLVHEQSENLGAKKALGFTRFEITKLFLGYALLACIFGILVGAIFGAPIVQLVLTPKMNQYTFETPGVLVNAFDVVEIGLIQIVLNCLFAWFACRSVLKKSAISLLMGYQPSKAKRGFYEGWASWKRASLLTQTMVTNCFNDKRRVFGTLVGVAGCTALIVCAITLQGGIKKTTDQQETVIEKYDQVVYVDESTSSTSATTANASAQTVDSVIASKGYTYLRAQYTMKSVALPDGSKALVTFIVPENISDVSNVMTIRAARGDVSLTKGGVYISSALADYYHYEPGDELELDSEDGVERSATISGVFDYYGGTHVAIMDKDAYKSCFGADPVYMARLVDSGSAADEFSREVKAATDFDGIVDSREITHMISETVNNLALTVVAIYMFISALVALFVLLNLDFMYIAEKKRELVVMMINGYSVKDAKRYVSHDTIIMNTVGMIIGCLLGTWMGMLAIQSLQNNRLSFIEGVSEFAWVVGIVVCAVFSFIVMHIALRRVDKFKLTSINE